MNFKGIDISVHNGNIDWDALADVDFVIIRAGYGRLAKQKDKMFETNYTGAKKAGLHVGAYWYSYAQNAAEAILEAKACLKVIKGKKFDMPIYFDIEEKSQVKLGRAVCSSIVHAFCNELEKAGYWVGVYSFDSFFKTNLKAGIEKRYATWVARVENIKPSCFKPGIHQYSWKGRIKGINGDVDMNKCYIDYPTLMKKAHKNGW